MSGTYYNPDAAPDASKWLALPEMERIRLAQNFHVSARVKLPRLRVHAIFHAAVENQIASGYGPSKRAIERLVSDGLSRHEAVHAIGFVLRQFVFEQNKGQSSEQQASFQSRMGAVIENLHAEQWRSSSSGDSDG